MDAWDDWQPGPAGQAAVRGSADQWVNLDTRPLRRAARFVMWSALAGLAGVIALTGPGSAERRALVAAEPAPTVVLLSTEAGSGP